MGEGEDNSREKEEPVSIVDEARSIRDEIKSEREKLESERKKLEEANATAMLSGSSDNIPPVEKSEESKEKEEMKEFWKGTSIADSIEKYG